MCSHATSAFKIGPSEPLFDGPILTEIEDAAGGNLPLDLVVYLLNFSQYLVPQTNDQHSMFALACTTRFTRARSWAFLNTLSAFTEYEDMAMGIMEDFRQQSIPSYDIHEEVNDETLQYLRNAKSLTFAICPRRR